MIRAFVSSKIIHMIHQFHLVGLRQFPHNYHKGCHSPVFPVLQMDETETADHNQTVRDMAVLTHIRMDLDMAGYYQNPHPADSLVVSMDGGNQAVYHNYHMVK